MKYGMKKLVSTVLACTVLLGLASCHHLSSDQTTTVSDSVSEETSGTTASEETTNAAFLTFDEVQKTVFGNLDYDESNLSKPDEKGALKNTYIGITDMVRLKIEDDDAESDDDKVKVEAYIFEFDTDSYEYKHLRIDEWASYFMDNGFPEGAKVKAINGKYVLCVMHGGLHECIKAFTGLPVIFSDPVDKPEPTFEYVFTKIHAGLLYMNSMHQDEETAKNNKTVGIADSAKAWLEYDSKQKDGSLLSIQNYVRVFEFDVDSEEFKSLKEGQKYTYYIGSEKKEGVVTAINGKYVIAFETFIYDKNHKLITEEYGPEFTEKYVQKAYDTFINT